MLQVSRNTRFPISCISGSSIGSILGAAYASGTPLLPDHSEVPRNSLSRFCALACFAFWLASNDRLGALVQRCFDSRQFEDLVIPRPLWPPTSAQVIRWCSNRAVWRDAIRASCAFPGLFEPVQIGTRCLADGGLVAPVPTHAARELGAEIVVGISVGLHDGQRGAPTNIFQVVSRAVKRCAKASTRKLGAPRGPCAPPGCASSCLG